MTKKRQISKATKELSMRKQNRQTNQLSKIALWLYGFYRFFIVGVTLSGNDYYKKAIIP